MAIVTFVGVIDFVLAIEAGVKQCPSSKLLLLPLLLCLLLLLLLFLPLLLVVLLLILLLLLVAMSGVVDAEGETGGLGGVTVAWRQFVALFVSTSVPVLVAGRGETEATRVF